jgi:hypothetical protein
LSDNNPKYAQTNTVVVQQEKVDRVEGFEPTASASKGSISFRKMVGLKEAAWEQVKQKRL